MTELLTSAQMQAIEQAAIGSGAATGRDLMERAGRGVVEAVFEQWPALARAPHRAVVVCGPGNNGGDGFVVARLLKDWGWQPEVYLYGDPGRLPADARANCERWRRMGKIGDLQDAPHRPRDAHLFVDALFGTGLRRPLEGKALDWVAAQASDPGCRARTVAVDVPSGLCSDSGRALGAAGQTVRAALTVAFHAPKRGHYLGCGASSSGRTVVADIGLKVSGRSASGGSEAVRLVTPPAPDRLAKADAAHKYGHGHAFVVTGGPGRTGAARLAARGALRIGAGLVTLGVPPGAQMEVATQVTAVMLKRVADGDALGAVLEDDRLNALCLGPGLGAERARDLLPVALRAGRATVLDADALTAHSDDPQALVAMLHGFCVLTPHGGEFARLFPDIAERLAATPPKGPAWSKVDAVREAARRAGCVVLLKGPDTVIAAPDGQCSISSAQYERAAPWLATAGAGDVLAGFITGLLARGLPPMQAAETAAWLHVEAARSFGPGLIAEDLPEALPRVFHGLGR